MKTSLLSDGNSLLKASAIVEVKGATLKVYKTLLTIVKKNAGTTYCDSAYEQ